MHNSIKTRVFCYHLSHVLVELEAACPPFYICCLPLSDTILDSDKINVALGLIITMWWGLVASPSLFNDWRIINTLLQQYKLYLYMPNSQRGNLDKSSIQLHLPIIQSVPDIFINVCLAVIFMGGHSTGSISGRCLLCPQSDHMSPRHSAVPDKGVCIIIHPRQWLTVVIQFQVCVC